MSEKVNVIQPSLAAGELTPEVYGRVDLAKYRAGARIMRNFFVLATGGAASRPGTGFVGRCRISNIAQPPRLFPFQYSTQQTYVLEFGHLYIRFITNGGYILEPAKAIASVTQAAPGAFNVMAHDYAIGDQLYIAGSLGMTGINSTRGFQLLVATAPDANHFTATDLDGNAINTAAMPAYTGGGTVARVYTLATPYQGSDINITPANLATGLQGNPGLKITQDDDVLTITHPSYAPMDLNRIQQWEWTLTAVDFEAPVASPTGVVAARANASSNPTFIYAYVVTAVVQSPSGQSLPSVVATCTNVALDQSNGTCNNITWNAVPGANSYNVYGTAPANNNGTTELGSVFGYIGQTQSCAFTDANISPDYSNQPPTDQDPFAPSAIDEVQVTAGGTGYVNPVATITDSTGTGAVLTVYQSGGVVSNAVVENGGENYTAPVIDISDSGGGPGTGATATATVGEATGTYPGCSTYFQGRRIFGASNNNPDTLWGTQTDNFTSMDTSNPPADTDALTEALSSQQVNGIKNFTSMTSLLALTSSGAWLIQSTNGPTGAITPQTIQAVPQAYIGASDVPPIAINYDVLYVTDKQSAVRDLTFNYYVNLYIGDDKSILSNHLFQGRQIQQWAYAEEPYKVIWSVRDDGVLLSFTFLKEQEIYGWARHDSWGLFESVATVSEGQENPPYFIVTRFIPGVNGGKPVQYVERMHTRNMGANLGLGIQSDVALAWCVDCGIGYGPSIVTGANLFPGAGAAVGGTQGVPFSTDAAAFSGGSVGQVIRANGGAGTIASYVSTTEVTVDIWPWAPFTPFPNDPNLPANPGAATALPALSGNWSCTTPVASISGLDHLNGATVAILADGNVQPQQVVANGTIALPGGITASIIRVGLPYTAQLMTMALDLGDPTIQGKRKRVAALNLILQDTRGLKAAPVKINGDTANLPPLVEIKERTPVQNYGQPVPLTTGFERVIPMPLWQREGVLMLEQSNPLPATILALVPEIVVGDDPG